MVLEKIQVSLELLSDKFTRPMKAAEKSMKELNKQAFQQGANFRNMSSKTKDATNQISAFRMQNMKFGQVMNMSMDNFKSFNQQGFKFTTMGGRAANGIRNLTHGMRGFRMEALGVMFFGMALVGMFKKLFSPVSEAFGISELFGMMLMMLFLPIMEAIFPVLLGLMTWFMNLSPGVKKAIGIFVILIGVFGAIIMILGTLALGLGSLILFWPIIVSTIGGAIATIIGSLGLFIVPILLIIAIVVGMYLAWKENFLGMKSIVQSFVEGFKTLFSGIINFFTGLFLIIKGIFTGDWSMIWEGVKKIFLGAVQAIWGLTKMLVAGIFAILIGIVKIVWNIIKLVVAPFVWLWNFLVGHSLIPDLINAIIDWFKKLPGKIWDIVKNIGKMIADGFVNMLPDWIIKILKKGINFVAKIFDRGGSSQSEDDFIWRPGQGAVGINPNDTLVGFKGAAPNLGGGSGGANVTNNFYGFTNEDLIKELDDRDRKMVSQMERNR